MSPDCYGHLRRALLTAHDFPRVPVRDPFLNHPEGGVWIWPPLFDLLLGGVARVAFGPGVTLEQTTRVAAAVPPVLGALHVVPLFLLARRALSRRRALLAVTAYSLTPIAAIWSAYGHADQHVAEVLALLVFLATAARAAAPDLTPLERHRWAALAGLALAGCVLTWQGAVFAAGLGFLWAAFALGSSAPVLAAAATAATALGTAAFCWGQRIPFTFVSFGWFQPALLAAGTAALALLAGLRSASRRERTALLTLALAASAVVAPLSGRLLGAVLRGGAYVATHVAGESADEMEDGGLLSYPRDFLAVVAEAQPLLAPSVRARAVQVVEELSPGLLFLPLALLLWLRPRRSDRALLALFGTALLLMTLSQRRNVYYLAVFTALALAEAVARVRPLAGRRSPLLRVAACAGLVFLPGLPQLPRLTSYAGAPGSDLVDVLRRLREAAPPPDPAPQEPGAVEGVMAPWSAGHFVSALVGRPAAADPNTYGWRRSCRFFATPDDAEAEAILRQARCGWVLTTDLRPVLPLYAAASDRAGVPMSATFGVRLHEATSPRPVPFLEHVLDSRTAMPGSGGRLVPRFRVWRVVPR